jgi:hypothetical protein
LRSRSTNFKLSFARLPGGGFGIASLTQFKRAKRETKGAIMKFNRRQLIITMTMSVLFILGGAVGLLRADNGTCNGANVALPFMDVAGNGLFCQIAGAYFSGLTNGTTATTYSPNDYVPRAQMAAFVTRTLDQSLKRGSRRAALDQWWTPQVLVNAALTPVDSDPWGVKSDGENLWVANKTGGTVTCVRARDGKTINTWDVMSQPRDLLIINGLVYVAGGANPGQLYLVNPNLPPGLPGAVTDLGDVVSTPVGMAFNGRHILIAGDNPAGVTIYNIATGAKATHTSGFGHLRGALYDGNAFWVTDEFSDKLQKVATNGQIQQSVPVGSFPRHPVFDGINIWVPNHEDNSVTVVRAATGVVLATLTGNGLNGPHWAAFDGERILVTNFDGDSVSLWRATDLAPLGSVSTGASSGPLGACSDGLNFWITLTSSDKLARF